MTELIPIPLWLLITGAVCSFILGMIAEVSAQHFSEKEKDKPDA